MKAKEFRLRYLAAVLAGWGAFGVHALPIDPTVTNGSATFAQTANTLNVTNSNGAIINWQAFSIGSNETVKFIQSSASSSVLNRVVGPDPSVLLGMMQSNGQVFLINTAGILVGAGARIDVARFVASTLPLSDADFLAGRFNFQGFNGAGDLKVENGAEITTASGGSVYLIAPNVENKGIIKAPNGEVILAAGSTVQLYDTASPGVKVEITGNSGNATNLGTVVADAGRVGLVGALVKNGGTLSASSAVSEGGRVFLRATNGSVTQTADGKIEANGTKGGTVSIQATDTALVDGSISAVGTAGTGGSIDVFANKVGLINSASLDASGATDGGNVRIGGDYQGKNADVQNAWVTWFGPDARVKADAGVNGNGGRVIVWSDDTTRFYGQISAKGGSASGDGGFTEVSGKRYLAYMGQVDLSSPFGAVGVLLLDPSDLEVIAGSTIDSSNNMTLDSTGYFQTSSTAASTLGWSNIQSALNSAALVVYTTNNLKITGSPTGTSATISHVDGGNTFSTTYTNGYNSHDHNLSFLAGNDIEVEATFGNASGSGALTLMAGWNGTSTASPATKTSGTDAIYVGNDSGSVVIFNSTGNVNLSSYYGVYIGGGGVYVGGNGGSQINSGIDLGSGALTVSTKNLELKGGSLGTVNQENFAFIYGNGNQTFNISSGGHVLVQGGGLSTNANDYGNSAAIQMFGSGAQQFVMSGNTDSITVTAGNGKGGAQYSSGTDCPTGGSVYCTSNYAGIMVRGTGSQSFSFSGTGGTLSITGGTNGGATDRGGNYAQVKADTGSQTISGDVAISLVSTSDGGVSGVNDNGNEAFLGTDGTQTISATSLSLNATGVGAAGIGGAYVVGSTQHISLTGNLSLSGGASNAASQYNASGAAVLGYDDTANIQIQAANVTLTAGTGTYGGAIIGSVNNTGTSSVSITTNNGFFATNASAPAGTYDWAMIGSLNGSANISITDTSSGGINLGQYSKLLAGIGTVSFSAANAGGVSLTQDANSMIVADTVTASGNRSLTFDGLNNVDNFNGISTLAGVSYKSSARTVHVGYASGTTVTLSTRDDADANTLLGWTNAGDIEQRDIALGSVSASATSGTSVSIKTSGVILDDNDTGVVNVTTLGSATAELLANQNTGSGNTNTNTDSSLLAISADVDVPGTLTATAESTGYGGISIRSVGTSAPANMTLQNKTTDGTDIFFAHYGDFVLTSAHSMSATSGDVTVAATGDLTYSGGALTVGSGKTLALVAGDTLNISSILQISRDLELVAGSTLNVTASTYGYGVTVVAPIINITGTSLFSPYAGGVEVVTKNLNITSGGSLSAYPTNEDVDILATGNITLSGGSTISAGNDVDLIFTGSSSQLSLSGNSKVIANNPHGWTTHLNFLSRSSGGLVIDGVEVNPSTYVTTAGGSGFYINGGTTVATPGNGLSVVLAATDASTSTVTTNDVIKAIASTTSSTSTTTTTTTTSTSSTSSSTSDSDDSNKDSSTNSGGTTSGTKKSSKSKTCS